MESSTFQSGNLLDNLLLTSVGVPSTTVNVPPSIMASLVVWKKCTHHIPLDHPFHTIPMPPASPNFTADRP